MERPARSPVPALPSRCAEQARKNPGSRGGGPVGRPLFRSRIERAQRQPSPSLAPPLLSPSLSPPPCGIDVPAGQPSAVWDAPLLPPDVVCVVLAGGELLDEPHPVSTPPTQTTATSRSAKNGRILTRDLLSLVAPKASAGVRGPAARGFKRSPFMAQPGRSRGPESLVAYCSNGVPEGSCSGFTRCIHRDECRDRQRGAQVEAPCGSEEYEALSDR